ncbi:MAG: hypothetical protein P4M09_31995 [Devosia sp.]|nr:hypothetical protein [Devosia sp.]
MLWLKRAWNNFLSIFVDDWRARWVAVSFFVALIVTIAIPMLSMDARAPATMWGAIYAAWVGGLLLFAVTGLVLGAVTLVRPDLEPFRERAWNLLQRQTGPHIDYMIRKLTEANEPYCVEMERTLFVTDYDEVSHLFLVTQETRSSFRGYLPDIAMDFPASIGYVNATPAPSTRQRCCLAYLRLDGQEIGTIEEFDTEIRRPFRIKAEARQSCEVLYRMTFWVKEETEPNRQVVKRFTRSLKVAVENQMPSRSVSVQNQGKSHFVPAGQREEIVNLAEIWPVQDEQTFAYDFRLTLVERHGHPR